MRIVLVSVLLNACSAGTDSSRAQNIFGNDDRVAVTTHNYPWNTIGKLAGIGCTGTLVGRDLVLTAAHCVVSQTTGKLRTDLTDFQPNYVAGTFSDSSKIIDVDVGSFNVPTPTRHDWALMRLEQPLGERIGWLPILATNTRTFPDTLTVVGYSGDFLDGETAGAHNICSTRGRDESEGWIEHDCDTARGASGGPAVRYYDQQLKVIGLNVAERRPGDASVHVESYEARRANILIPTSDFLRQWQRLEARRH